MRENSFRFQCNVMNEYGKTEKGFPPQRERYARVLNILVSIDDIWPFWMLNSHSKLWDSRVLNVVPWGLLTIRSENCLLCMRYFCKHLVVLSFWNKLPFVKSENLINLIELTKSYLVELNQIRGINWVSLILGKVFSVYTFKVPLFVMVQQSLWKIV